ncbi:hypothetical protein ACQKP5_00295 [Pseudomonas vancouverensis]|uniref:hypothetical protein n=1 Tax=Pseudomonas vancouverensis TaxID=95300 RepID=UPI003D02A6B3
MKISIICALASLLVPLTASATGVMPVFDLDFTRSATETLKKIGIQDACIIGASNPVTFTYCREGSSTLWQYQALDLEQQAALQSDTRQSSASYQPVTIVEFNSAACAQDVAEESVMPVAIRWITLGLIGFFLLLGWLYTPRRQRNGLPVVYAQPLKRPMILPHSTIKAVTAFGFAAFGAFIYFSISR